MPVKFKDYYEVLGISRTASDEEIKKSFRKLARQYHPDVAKTKKGAEEKFKEINEAYEVLGDPAKRKKYDELGADWKQGAEFRPPPGWQSSQGGYGGGGSSYGGAGDAGEFEFGGTTGFSDFFEQMFGSRGSGRFGRRNTEERGNDVEGEIMVTLEEAMHGSVRSVTLRHGAQCETCGGTGVKGRRACPTCGGKGEVLKSETFQVKIPPGITEGKRLRIPGHGEGGRGRGAAGDLYLTVRLAKHPDFDVDDHNLIYEAELAPWEAVLGANIAVPTMSGKVNIKVPPGTQSGQKLRVRGRGLPTGSNSAGDLIVTTRIEVPQNISEEERKLWDQLAQASHFHPREK